MGKALSTSLRALCPAQLTPWSCSPPWLTETEGWTGSLAQPPKPLLATAHPCWSIGDLQELCPVWECYKTGHNSLTPLFWWSSGSLQEQGTEQRGREGPFSLGGAETHGQTAQLSKHTNIAPRCFSLHVRSILRFGTTSQLLTLIRI